MVAALGSPRPPPLEGVLQLARTCDCFCLWQGVVCAVTLYFGIPRNETARHGIVLCLPSLVFGGSTKKEKAIGFWIRKRAMIYTFSPGSQPCEYGNGV